MNYVIGLDIGIGSIGWAVIRNDEKKRIEDFGVRIFESGENSNGKNRISQDRRGFRATRRLVRRRSHRKNRLKAYLECINLIKVEEIKAYFEKENNNVIKSRVKGLDEKLTPEEIAACLINICNRRGYKDFYELDTESLSSDEKKEYQEDRKGIELVNQLMNSGKYRSIAEMILLDDTFISEGHELRRYRNKDDFNILINRTYLQKEVSDILEKQSEYYTCLNSCAIEEISNIIFSQRCFEDGPGDPNNPYRKYTGFIGTEGNCRFFKDQKRGCRFTVIADIYSLVNVLSQYKYIDKKTGEVHLSKKLANNLIDFAIKNASIQKKDVKKIAKELGFTVIMDSCTDSITKSLKFIKPAKKILEASGYDWSNFITEEAININSKLNEIGILLSKHHTPSRRKIELKKLSYLNEIAINKFTLQRVSGTSNVGYEYMQGAIEAFFEGDIYGDYQAKVNKELKNIVEASVEKYYKLPSFESEKNTFEFYKNPVVFRSINETRKIINAIIEKYGSPSAINVEVASELNKCYENREKDRKYNEANEKARQKAIKEICDLMEISENEVNQVMIDKFRLGENQGWKCLYSQQTIDKKNCLSKNNRAYEIDHIIPFSLILDNTINNKALVCSSENQYKRQRTPLMYLNGEKREAFIGAVNTLFKENKISKKKYAYLLTESLDNEELFSEWKSRNLNDTRYISKFLVNYLSNNLLFAEDNESLLRKKTEKVYAVKSAITSRFRRQWLNNTTWGVFDKSKLKAVTYLDHAVDSVVIANCLPAYVEIASENNKLKSIYKNAGRKTTNEYSDSLKECISRISMYYGMDKEYIEKLLRFTEKTPSLIPDLRNEVEYRFIDPDIFREWEKKSAKKQNRDVTEYTDEQIMQTFRKNIEAFYSDDIKFAKQINMPLTSYKIERKFSGEATKANPVSIKNIDGTEYSFTRKKVTSIKKSQLNKIYTDDTDLKESLIKLFEGQKDKDTVGDILKSKGKDYFVTEKGNRVNKVTLYEKAENYVTKRISDNNYTCLPNGKYYCVEFYKTIDNKLGMRGVMYSDLIKSDGKLWLKEDHNYPKDYKEHIMYLQKHEYIEVIDNKGKIKEKSGYFINIYSINQNSIRTAKHNTPCNQKKPLSIAKNDMVRKIYVDILGKKGGVVKCGEPLLSIKEKKSPRATIG